MADSRFRAGVLMVCATVLSSLALACHKPAGNPSLTFQVQDAWIRAAADTGATTAAYMRLVNGSDIPLSVSKFSVDDARATELHETVRDANNMLSMEPRDSIIVPAHGEYELKPGGSHVMIIGTARALAAGDKVHLTMHLSTGAIVGTYATVRAP